MRTKPIKRMEALRPLSREHHQALLLCWKIRAAFAKKIPLIRVKKYTDWFFIHHIQPHFEVEEQYIFPILGEQHPFVKKALMQHRRIAKLFVEEEQIERSLSRLEDELAGHIRFEERMLFNEVQKVASRQELRLIAEKHPFHHFEENTKDVFWD
ncbi:MAG: hypothetical protein R2806_25545 [Saprospiraceae bacterium]